MASNFTPSGCSPASHASSEQPPGAGPGAGPELQSTSNVATDLSDGSQSTMHDSMIPESLAPQPGEIESNAHLLDAGHSFAPASGLSTIQEERVESSGEARNRSMTSDPRIIDAELDAVPVAGGHEPVGRREIHQEPTSPTSPTMRLSIAPEPAQLPPILATLAQEPAQFDQPNPVFMDDAISEISATSSLESMSVFEVDTASSYTASLLSEAKNFTYENGRRYHSYREGMYVLPNDELEQDRQDLLHHVRNLVLRGRLFQSPLDTNNIQRILDIGTGTGIWAIDAADAFPAAQVIGTDLSPIQPSWVPPNCRFIVDDAEADWLYNTSQPFDLIHARDMGGAVGDWPRLLDQGIQHLRPGGWLELCEFEVMLRSDDDSIALAPTLCEFLGQLSLASAMFNRPMNIAQRHRQHLVEAGFEDVQEKVIKVPSNTWPTDPHQQEIGKYNLCSLLLAVESYSLALFTRVLGWTNEKTQVFLAGVRRDLKDPNVRTYCNLHVVYGRKPSQ